MIDFDDGNLKPYEEVWRDEDVTGSGRVLAADCTSKGFKGLVVILGNWCQALVKSRDGTFAGRWTRTRGGGWKNVFMVGEVLDTNLPVILESATGEEVVVGFKWTVVETAVL